MGITQLSYFFRFTGGIIAIVLGIVHGGKISLIGLVPKLFNILKLIKPTFSNFKEVWDEFRDLDQNETEALRVLMAYELELDETDDKDFINEVITWSLHLLSFITRLKKS